jgi:hypothetical protein
MPGTQQDAFNALNIGVSDGKIIGTPFVMLDATIFNGMCVSLTVFERISMFCS